MTLLVKTAGVPNGIAPKMKSVARRVSMQTVSVHLAVEVGIS